MSHPEKKSPPLSVEQNNRVSPTRRGILAGITGLGVGQVVRMGMSCAGVPLFGSLALADSPPSRKLPPKMSAPTQSLNRLGWELFGKLSQEDLFLSPSSIGLALAMAEQGARGETRDQMRKVLHLGDYQNDVDPGWRAIIDSLRAEKPGRQVSLANRLFGQKDYGFLPEYTARLGKWFDAPLEEVDYQNSLEKSRSRINSWVEEQTRDMIKDLIPPGALTPMARLVLVNAIHFKGEWLAPFEKNSTREEPFETAPGKSITVSRMNKTGSYVTRATSTAEALELPCKGGDRSVHFILPKKRHGLAAVEKTITSEDLDTLLFAEAQPSRIKLGLPKFHLESNQTLNAGLISLGMPLAFVPKADFSGMNGGKEPLFIDAVIHKAVLVVDEKGAEAAAATAIMMRTLAARVDPPKEFLVDQPFLVAITDKTTKGILFLGRVVTPKAK